MKVDCKRNIIDLFIKNEFYGQEHPFGESTSTVRNVNYQLLAALIPTKPNVQLPVAVDHSQLRTMAAETVDPIDCPSIPSNPPHPLQGVPSECHLQMRMRATDQECSKRDRSRDLWNNMGHSIVYAATEDGRI